MYFRERWGFSFFFYMLEDQLHLTVLVAFYISVFLRKVVEKSANLAWDVESHGLISQKHRGITEKKINCYLREDMWFLLME